MSSITNYPYTFSGFNTITPVEEIIKHNTIDNGVHLSDQYVYNFGRILAIREASKKLYFITIQCDGQVLQLANGLQFFNSPDKFSIHSELTIGDIVSFGGHIGKTKHGELSIFCHEIEKITPCMHTISKSYYGINDPDIRYRQRYLDMIVNQDTISTFIKRSKIVKSVRDILDNHGFIEVETPIISNNYGGANAKPFTTYYNDLKQDMYLRIAPELYLKQLVIGGMPRVYEIGKVFRNEGIDKTHNPEFTSMECYYAPGDYNKMLELTEEIMAKTTLAINNSYDVVFVDSYETRYEINMKPPYNRIDIIDKLEECTGYKLSSLNNDEATKNLLDEILFTYDIACSFPRTIPRMLDKLIGHFIEPLCIQPTFLIHHPMVMSPLSKPHRDDPNKSERFELFIIGREFANAYTELNIPEIQRNNFMAQSNDKNNGDDEAQIPDMSFVTALEYGLPPTGGLGIGIDRFTMLLTNKNTIREVILFPTLKNNK